MKSPLALLVPAASKPPVPLVSRSHNRMSTMMTGGGGDRTAQMEAYGRNSVLHTMVSRLANSTASVDWHLYRKAASGNPDDRTLVPDGSHASQVLLDQPNPFFDRHEFIEGTQQHIDLTGEGWWVITKSAGIPIGMWYIRPDRMQPVPDPDRYLKGYLYTAPDGTDYALQLDEVIQMKMPNPLDPYRGLGPVQAALLAIESAELAEQWNRNFFKNDATPGGVMEVQTTLTTEEFDEIQERWAGGHQGVSNAHRVAIIEAGVWKDRAFNMRDMQFAELDERSIEKVRITIGFPKPMLGSVDDVNRANNEAQKAFYAEHLVVPRLDRIKGAVNGKLLPMFKGWQTLEWDYDNPVPPDRQQEMEELRAKAEFVAKLVPVGFEPAAVLETAGLPDMPFSKPAPAAPPVPPGGDDPEADDKAKPKAVVPRVHNADEAPDMSQELALVQADWTAELTRILGLWVGVTAQHRENIVRQVAAATGPEQLAEMSLADATVQMGADELAASMARLAAVSSQRMVDEAAAQGVNLPVVVLLAGELREWALAVSLLLGGRLLLSAAREAIRLRTDTVTGAELGAQVRQHLDSLSDREQRDLLGGALTNSQNSARIETLRHAPPATPSPAYYADETLDSETCGPCAAVDKRWLGNTLGEVDRLYPNGGYVACKGRERCRGTVTAVWRPTQTSEDR